MLTTANKHANLRKWIAALESGQYHPERGVMRSSCGFCTVGVAIDLFTPYAWFRTQNGTWSYQGHAFDEAMRYLPPIPRLKTRNYWTNYDAEGGQPLTTAIFDLNDTPQPDVGPFDRPLDLLKAWANGWNLEVGE